MTTLLLQQQQAGLGLIGWFVVFAAFYFLKDVVFKKDKPDCADLQSVPTTIST
ncbi:MAG: hypothetical protein V4698_05060 [Bacteroidota bacterium]